MVVASSPSERSSAIPSQGENRAALQPPVSSPFQSTEFNELSGVRLQAPCNNLAQPGHVRFGVGTVLRGPYQRHRKEGGILTSNRRRCVFIPPCMLTDQSHNRARKPVIILQSAEGLRVCYTSSSRSELVRPCERKHMTVLCRPLGLRVPRGSCKHEQVRRHVPPT